MNTNISEVVQKRKPGRPANKLKAREALATAPSTPAISIATTDEVPHAARKTRKPFGSRSQKLAYEAREGFHRHWFNDVPGRIMDAHDAGYEHVKDKEGKNVSRPVGVNDAGNVMMAFLMETPEEFYKEDMAAQQSRADETDRAVRRGELEGAPGKDGRYVPSQGIKIGTR